MLQFAQTAPGNSVLEKASNRKYGLQSPVDMSTAANAQRTGLNPNTKRPRGLKRPSRSQSARFQVAARRSARRQQCSTFTFDLTHPWVSRVSHLHQRGVSGFYRALSFSSIPIMHRNGRAFLFAFMVLFAFFLYNILRLFICLYQSLLLATDSSKEHILVTISAGCQVVLCI